MAFRFPEAALQFLRDLDANNTKDWFQANKKRYERDLKKPAQELAAALNDILERVSPGHVRDKPNKALNRINRDIRFSKDKTPYNTRVWAGFHLSSAPKGQSAGYYFGITLDGCGVGTGVWQPDKEHMASLRSWFAEHHRRYNAVVQAPDFTGTYSEGHGAEKYKRVPKPYPADHPAAELLKLKGVHYSADLDVSLVTSPDLLGAIEGHFTRLKPVVDLLNEGLGVAG